MRRIALIFLLLALAPGSAAAADSLRVAAAISLKDVLTRIALRYEQDTGRHADLVFGSSGQLAAQIRNGAPIDVFISAAQRQVQELDKAGLADAAAARIVARNRLVLIIPSRETAPLALERLGDPSVKRVAIGEPNSVPAGQYARQALKNLHLDATLSDRMIYGANVRQVLDYVERGEVSAGIVYATDAKRASDKIKVVASADPSLHDPIVYPAVIIRTSQKNAQAADFLDYLVSKDVKLILTEEGFISGADPTTNTAAGK